MFRISPFHHQELFLQAVFSDLVCGATVRTTRQVQALLRNGWTYRVNSLIKTFRVSCWTAYVLQDDKRSLQYQPVAVLTF